MQHWACLGLKCHCWSWPRAFISPRSATATAASAARRLMPAQPRPTALRSVARQSRGVVGDGGTLGDGRSRPRRRCIWEKSTVEARGLGGHSRACELPWRQAPADCSNHVASRNHNAVRQSHHLCPTTHPLESTSSQHTSSAAAASRPHSQMFGSAPLAHHNGARQPRHRLPSNASADVSLFQQRCVRSIRDESQSLVFTCLFIWLPLSSCRLLSAGRLPCHRPSPILA